MRATQKLPESTDFPALFRKSLKVLQVNLGYLCNMQCTHCHVNAGPKRKEIMSKATINLVLDYLRKSNVKTLDLTGGAPEMNPHFKYLVASARQLNCHLIDRCNLTILEDPEQNDLANFLAKWQVEIVASLPCYVEENVDRQRGEGTFESSLAALKRLNRLGYGKRDSSLILNLVYNPQGPTLAPSQTSLEQAYKKHLKQDYNIDFNQLFVLTNMPIQRFGTVLKRNNQFHDYMRLLRHHHKVENIDSLMCRDLISVDWQGDVYDCDFNQMLNLPLGVNGKGKTHLSELIKLDLKGEPITVDNHCYACTAGQGSSCSGALLN